jgi:cobalamin biosynthesis protein CobD/CbiB
MTSSRRSRQRLRNFEAFAIGQSEASAIGVLGFRFGVRGVYFGVLAQKLGTPNANRPPPAFSIEAHVTSVRRHLMRRQRLDVYLNRRAIFHIAQL